MNNLFFYVHFFGAKKRTKEASTPSKSSPIWEDLTAPPVAHLARYSSNKFDSTLASSVGSTHQRVGLSFFIF